MQTIQATYTEISKPVNVDHSLKMRIGLSIPIAGIITFVLFAAMHALIEQHNIRPSTVEPITISSSILDIPEEKTIRRTFIKPPPVLESKPFTQVDTPNEAKPNAGFSSEISIPKVSTNKLTFNVSPLDQQPRPLVRIDPRYPASAASNGIEGFVTLTFSVSASGEVLNIEVIDAEPKRTFNRAAIQALRKWRYQPKMVDGSPSQMDGLQVRLDFNLATD
jgi:protein TonB